MPRWRSINIQSERARKPSRLALTAPASWIAPPNSSSFSVKVVLPASGCEMMAKVRRRRTSSARFCVGSAMATAIWGIGRGKARLARSAGRLGWKIISNRGPISSPKPPVAPGNRCSRLARFCKQRGLPSVYTLYWAPTGANMAAHAALIEIGAPYDLVLVDIDKGEHRSEAYRKIQPHSRVPALRHGNLVMYESAAILLYLADRHTEAGHAPALTRSVRGHITVWV